MPHDEHETVSMVRLRAAAAAEAAAAEAAAAVTLLRVYKSKTASLSCAPPDHTFHLHGHYVRSLRKDPPSIDPRDRHRRILPRLRMASQLPKKLPLPVVSLPGTVVRALLHSSTASRLLPRDCLERRRERARQVRPRGASGAQANLGRGQVGDQRSLAEAGLAQGCHVL